MTKAIFLDVDGTLLSFETHRMSASTAEALTKVHQSGVKLIIATGRAYSDLSEIEQLPYDAVVALNGANCMMRSGVEVSRLQIGLDDFNKSRQLARQYDFAMAVETNRGIMVDRLTPDIVDTMRLVNHPVPPVGDIEKEFVDGRCCQLCFFCDKETEAEVMRQLPGLCASRWHPAFADVNVATANKGQGVRAFAKYYGIALSETMAFGDGGNDIPMLRVAGVGVAMGNASDIVKREADYVTLTVDNDGVRSALEHFGLIDETTPT